MGHTKFYRKPEANSSGLFYLCGKIFGWDFRTIEGDLKKI